MEFSCLDVHVFKFWKIILILASSADSDKLQFHLGMHCLP